MFYPLLQYMCAQLCILQTHSGLLTVISGQKCKKFNPTSSSSNLTVFYLLSFLNSMVSALEMVSFLGVCVCGGGARLAKLGARLVVGKGDVVVVGCAAGKGCVRPIY